MQELIALRLIHVLGGIFWVGATAFTTFFLLPVLAQSGAAAAQIMMGMQKRRFMVVMPIVALLTILSGIRLMMIASNASAGAYFQTGSGRAIATSGLLAIVAFLIGVTVIRPATTRAASLSGMAASGEIDRQRLGTEIARLQKRAAMSGIAVTTLLILAAAGMAVARYL